MFLLLDVWINESNTVGDGEEVKSQLSPVDQVSERLNNRNQIRAAIRFCLLSCRASSPHHPRRGVCVVVASLTASLCFLTPERHLRPRCGEEDKQKEELLEVDGSRSRSQSTATEWKKKDRLAEAVVFILTSRVRWAFRIRRILRVLMCLGFNISLE